PSVPVTQPVPSVQPVQAARRLVPAGAGGLVVVVLRVPGRRVLRRGAVAGRRLRRVTLRVAVPLALIALALVTLILVALILVTLALVILALVILAVPPPVIGRLLVSLPAVRLVLVTLALVALILVATLVALARAAPVPLIVLAVAVG